MRSRKKRCPKLTRVEKLTQGLSTDPEEIKSRFVIKEVEGKGRSVFLKTKIIRKDSFVLEYEGDIVRPKEALFREKVYEHNGEGCFIMYFRFQGVRFAIDATRRLDSYARLLNHSTNPNIRFHPPLIVELTKESVPRIAAYALCDIHQGDEIMLDYGVRDSEITWLKNQEVSHITQLSESSSDDDSEDNAREESEDSFDMSFSIRQASNKNQNNSINELTQPLGPLGSMLPCSSSALSSRMKSANSEYVSFRKQPLAPHSQIHKRKLLADGEFNLRLVSNGQGLYFAQHETIGQPQKILRIVEDKKPDSSNESQSVISLYDSDSEGLSIRESSKQSSDSAASSSLKLPPNEEPSSFSKVLSWQQSDIPFSMQDPSSNIKILDVVSLNPSQNIDQPTPTSSCISKDEKNSYTNVAAGTNHVETCVSNYASKWRNPVTLRKITVLKSKVENAIGNLDYSVSSKNSQPINDNHPKLKISSVCSISPSKKQLSKQTDSVTPRNHTSSFLDCSYSGSVKAVPPKPLGAFQTGNTQNTLTSGTKSLKSFQKNQTGHHMTSHHTKASVNGLSEPIKNLDGICDDIESILSSSSECEIVEMTDFLKEESEASTLSMKASKSIAHSTSFMASEESQNTFFEEQASPALKASTSKRAVMESENKHHSLKKVFPTATGSTSGDVNNMKTCEIRLHKSEEFVKSSSSVQASGSSGHKSSVKKLITPDEKQQRVDLSTGHDVSVIIVEDRDRSPSPTKSEEPEVITIDFEEQEDEKTMSKDEIAQLEKIFAPHIMANNSSCSAVQDVIRQNFDVFKGMISRGVTLKTIRRTVWQIYRNKTCIDASK